VAILLNRSLAVIMGVDQLQMAPQVPDDSLLRFYFSRKSFCVATRYSFHPG